jgi:hypothetical protein
MAVPTRSPRPAERPEVVGVGLLLVLAAAGGDRDRGSTEQRNEGKT